MTTDDQWNKARKAYFMYDPLSEVHRTAMGRILGASMCTIEEMGAWTPIAQHNARPGMYCACLINGLRKMVRTAGTPLGRKELSIQQVMRMLIKVIPEFLHQVNPT
jgi:hypothetical protein